MVTGLLGFARRHQRAALFPVLALLLANTSWSQPNPPQQDPYLTLMMAQPKLEADGPVDPVATFDPPAVRPGETSIYRVTLRALEETVQWPEKISAPEQLQLSPGARGQIFQMGRPGTMVAVTVINTRVRATAEGEFTIPEFTLLINGKRITIPVAKLVVTNHPPAEIPSFKLALSLEPREAFVGQSVAARIALEEPPGVFQPLQQPQLVGDGILVDQSAARQQMTVAPRAGGSNVMEYTYETVLTPIQTGALKLFAQGFLSPSHFPANAFLAGVGGLNEGPSPSLLETDTAQLMVNPLPETGKLPGFTGAIGKLSMETPVLENDHVTAGEPVRLTARVETSPTLDRIIAPPPPVVRDWEIFAGSSNSPAPRLVQSRHYFTFDYILIPLSADSKETPAIPFSYFDPEEKKYRDLTIPSLPITVEPGAAAPNAAELVQSGPRGQNPEPELSLSGLALAPGKCVASLLPPQRNRWFLWSQCLPALVFFGLWRWDQRRRFFEQHPEIILRRRAKKALRAERKRVRAAERRRDPEAFASAAASAIRVACAPYFPAQPRALVASDILEALPSGDRQADAELVRALFSAVDERNFSETAADKRELLDRTPELDKLLNDLEARL